MGEVVPPPEILSADKVERIRIHKYSAYDRKQIDSLCASHEALRARVEAAEAERDAALAWKEAVASESTATLIRTGARVEALTAALTDVFDACDIGVGDDAVYEAVGAARRVLADGGTTDPVPTRENFIENSEYRDPVPPEVVDAARRVFEDLEP